MYGLRRNRGGGNACSHELSADYSTWIDDTDLREAEALARMDYEAWVHEDYCLRMEVLDAAVNEEESVRLRMMYENFQDGWSRDYLTESFVVVALVVPSLVVE